MSGVVLNETKMKILKFTLMRYMKSNNDGYYFAFRYSPFAVPLALNSFNKFYGIYPSN
jgi:hypothetical protein